MAEGWLIPRTLTLCSGAYTFNKSAIIKLDIKGDQHTYIAGFTFMLGLQTVLLNMYVLGYYREKREGVFPLYYFITTLCNSILGLDAVIHTILLLLYVLYSPEDTPGSQKLFNYLIFVTYTLTSTARNSKLVYNTILISMRAVKYCSPTHVFSRRTSSAVILLFPIGWMLFLAGTLDFQFALPAEVNMQQYIYYPERNTKKNSLRVVSICILYVLPLGIILTSLAVCLYKQRQKHRADYLHKLKADQTYRGVVQQPTYGQSKVTDVALTALLLACYLPYVVLMLIDVAYPKSDKKPNCTILFITGVILPFMNSAFDPVIFITYNVEMSGRISLRMRTFSGSCCNFRRRHPVNVRFDVDPGIRTMTLGNSERARGSMCIMKRWEDPAVIEYKDSSGSESDSSLESFEHYVKKHKSRRYR